jgi:hypothetical protein
MRFLAILCMAVALTACDAARDSSNEAARVSKTVVDDTRNAWRDLFTYHSPVSDQDPQTRFCYQMQSDVVCYDTPQTHMTSKLVGYQDGEHISFIQHGGGSLGVSTAQSQVFAAPPMLDNAAPYEDVSSSDDIYVGDTSAPAATGDCVNGPFDCKESSYVKDAEVGR